MTISLKTSLPSLRTQAGVKEPAKNSIQDSPRSAKRLDSTLSTAEDAVALKISESSALPKKEIAATPADLAPMKTETSDLYNSIDIQALVQFVLRESYLESNEDLKEYAESVKKINTQKDTPAREVVPSAQRREAAAPEQDLSTHPPAYDESSDTSSEPAVRRVDRKV